MARLMRIGEVSDQIGVSSMTIRRWVRAGRVPVSRSPGNRWFWTAAQVEAIRAMMDLDRTVVGQG